MEATVTLRPGEQVRYISGFENLDRLNRRAVKHYDRSIHLAELVKDYIQREQGRKYSVGDKIRDINFLICETILTEVLPRNLINVLKKDDVVRCRVRWGGNEADTFWLDMSLAEYEALPLWDKLLKTVE